MRSARFCVGEGVRGQAAGGDSGAGALGQGTDKSREILCLTKKAVCFVYMICLCKVRQLARIMFSATDMNA